MESQLNVVSLLKRKNVLLILLGCCLLLGLANAREGWSRSHWSKTRPEINLSHVFHGEINRRGKPVGFHSRPNGNDPAHAKLVKIVSRPNRSGVYTAKVKIFDPREKRWKKKFSSIFPDSMGRQQVINAILYAYRHRTTGKKQPWSGPSGHGFVIQGYTTSRGGINTAFPVFRR